MEKNLNLSIEKNVDDYSYSQQLDAIRTLTASKDYGKATDNCNQLIEIIKCDVMAKTNNFALLEKYTLLRDLVTANKKCYQNWFDGIFQEMTLQRDKPDVMYVFFVNHLNQSKAFLNQALYLQAICLCAALEQSLRRFLLIGRLRYQTQLQSLLIDCEIIYESAYYNWLKNNITSVIYYHFPDRRLRKKIATEYKALTNQPIESKYALQVDRYTTMIKTLEVYLVKAFDNNAYLNLAWQRYLRIERQVILFEWFMQNYQKLEENLNYFNLLEEDLKCLADENIFESKLKWEAKIKLHLIYLLAEEAICLQELNLINKEFCLAYDYFNTDKIHSLLALIFFGFGLLNAYEGNKQGMLQGFNLAVDYNPNLKNLRQYLIRQLPFCMKPIIGSTDLLINPLKQLESSDAIKLSTLKP